LCAARHDQRLDVTLLVERRFESGAAVLAQHLKHVEAGFAGESRDLINRPVPLAMVAGRPLPGAPAVAKPVDPGLDDGPRGDVGRGPAAPRQNHSPRDGRETSRPGPRGAGPPARGRSSASETGAALAQVAADVRAGGGTAALAMLADCDAAHEREVAYAAARKLPPAR
jgi:hypothetical protein